jgi:serine/threonine protein kinase/Tfp pilus assembly protein PilF
MPLAASTRLGPYEIVELLGAGAMGEVYRARDTRLERDVAVKILPERLAQDQVALGRFQREAKAIAQLSHPNIVAIHDIGSEQGIHYVVMELLEGQTLGKLLKRSALDWHGALDIAAALANGLAAAHARGVVHRDIKPENIFLAVGGGVKILDFGLARLNKPGLPADPSAATISVATQPGVLLGSIAYMSPEQVRGQPADARSDVFAFGCVLYEMVTGTRPFNGESTADVMAAILHGAPPGLTESGRERPAVLDRILARCLEKDPAKRYPSGTELLAALQAIGRDLALHDSGRDKQLETIRDQEATVPAGRPQPGASVAVLPFVNMSSDPENEFFSDGLAEELINALSKVGGLRVASRTSSFAFKGKNEDVRKIAEQLGVRTVLQGSVRKSGNRLRISAQLANAADGYQLWAETYNRQLEDVFAIQDEIAQSIAKALSVILTEKDKRALEKATPACDVRAYEYYLRGMQAFHQFQRRNLEQAVQMFSRAIELDPDYARAHAGLAQCYSLLHTTWNVQGDTIARADAASQKALELDPESAEAHTARGVALALSKRYDEAQREFETALRLNPNLFEAHYLYGRVCLARGQLTEAARQFAEASRVRPEDYQALFLGAGVLSGLGRKADAEAAYRRGVEVAENHLKLYPDDARALCLGAGAWYQLGERERALDWARRALSIDPDEPLTLYNVACCYSLMGQVDEALDTLAKAIEKGAAHREWIENDADLKPLHGHPRFVALLASLSKGPPG